MASNKYNRVNLVELIEKLTPGVYLDEDISLSGLGEDPFNSIINSHIRVAQNLSSILPISSIQNTQLDSLSSLKGIAQYFVKQNKLTNITPFSFNSKILVPLGTKLSDFANEDEFKSYLSTNLLPKIVPPRTGFLGGIPSNISTLSALTGENSASSVHIFLADTLGWFYFLNTSSLTPINSQTSAFVSDPSAYVADKLTGVYRGETLETVDGIKVLEEYIFKNYYFLQDAVSIGYLPTEYVPLSGFYFNDKTVLVPITPKHIIGYDPRDATSSSLVSSFQSTSITAGTNDVLSPYPSAVVFYDSKYKWDGDGRPFIVVMQGGGFFSKYDLETSFYVSGSLFDEVLKMGWGVVTLGYTTYFPNVIGNINGSGLLNSDTVGQSFSDAGSSALVTQLPGGFNVRLARRFAEKDLINFIQFVRSAGIGDLSKSVSRSTFYGRSAGMLAGSFTLFGPNRGTTVNSAGIRFTQPTRFAACIFQQAIASYLMWDWDFADFNFSGLVKHFQGTQVGQPEPLASSISDALLATSGSFILRAFSPLWTIEQANIIGESNPASLWGQARRLNAEMPVFCQNGNPSLLNQSFVQAGDFSFNALQNMTTVFHPPETTYALSQALTTLKEDFPNTYVHDTISVFNLPNDDTDNRYEVSRKVEFLKKAVPIEPESFEDELAKLENLHTLTDILYSPLYIDKDDLKVQNAFEDFIEAGLYQSNKISKGPLRKFNSVLGFNLGDISDIVGNIGLLYDIDNVPSKYLQNLADLIGFKLRGNSPSKWRHQLRIAVDLYKQTGTLKAIENALKALITESALDVSGKIEELYESYLPFLIWYSLGTESPYFKNLNSWTQELATKAGVGFYSTSSLEENIKIVVDSILLDLYKYQPDSFKFFGETFPVPKFYTLDSLGMPDELFTIINDPQMKPFCFYKFNSPEYKYIERDAFLFNELNQFYAATQTGPFGFGLYLGGNSYTFSQEIRPDYLIFDGDLEFVFSYRNKKNYPLPPFEEIKYYKDCTLSPDIVEVLIERLLCFGVTPTYAQQLKSFLLNNGFLSNSSLGALNEFLMFFKEQQIPPNFNSVLESISEYQINLLNLWNGKSSHLFINYDATSFDFTKETTEGNSATAIYELARVANEYSPAHTIIRLNVNASSEDSYLTDESAESHIDLKNPDNITRYDKDSVFATYELSGVDMGAVSPGNNLGRGGLNTFWRNAVESVNSPLLSSTTSVVPAANVARRFLRRKDYLFLLPKEGYYDRTGLNAPVTFDASVLERSQLSSLGELTLGYVYSSAKFYPVFDPLYPSGVWNECEGLNSPRKFFGVDTSNTFPYRGIYDLKNNKYVDRDQLPGIYALMFKALEQKAYSKASKNIQNNLSAYSDLLNWKDVFTSEANTLISQGYIGSSLDNYLQFKFGLGLHEIYKDYCTSFKKHPLSLYETTRSGGSIFSHIFGNALFNGDFSLEGSTIGYYAKTFDDFSAINTTNILKEGVVGTTVVSNPNNLVVPLLGEFSSGEPFNAEFRNPHIISGVEICDTSGAPDQNKFIVFNVSAGAEFFVNNPIIYNKSVGGFPRIRFNVSSYGDRQNLLIKDHEFELGLNVYVGEDNSKLFGGGQVGVWIHTNSVSGYYWNFMPNGKWELHKESELSRDNVIQKYAHIKTFELKEFTEDQKTFCLNSDVFGQVSVGTLLKSNFEEIKLKFNTFNYTENNNYQYLQILPVPEEYYKIKQLVHDENTNYIIEVFFVPQNNINKYMLLDQVILQDITLYNKCSIPLGIGIKSTIPLIEFSQEEVYRLNKEELLDLLTFFNGIAGLNVNEYYSNLGSRQANITSGILEVSGGSRLNARTNPEWGPNTEKANFNHYTDLEVIN